MDNVIQFTVVTATGDFLSVNSYQNTDIFWALGGGGRGTYAVVISATYLTHDVVPLTVMKSTANLTSPAVAKSVLMEFISIHPSLSDAGCSDITPSSLSFVFLAHNTSEADANKTFTPFMTFVRNATAGNAQIVPAAHKSLYEWYPAVFNPETAGESYELGSRLLLREVAETNPGKVADTLLAFDYIAMGIRKMTNLLWLLFV
jgi:hypothetical protein